MDGEARIARLERQLKRQRLLLGAVAIAGAGAALAAFTRPPADVIEAHAIRIVDAGGRPRILIGAPPPTEGRLRKDAQVTSLVVLGPDGHDRLVLGEMPAPDVQGRTAHRISPGYGLVIHDAKGAERGGLGFLDQGRAVLALDRPHGDAVGLYADDRSGWAGVIGMYPSNDSGQLHEAFRLGNEPGKAKLTLSGNQPPQERATLAVDGPEAPRLVMQAAR